MLSHWPSKACPNAWMAFRHAHPTHRSHSESFWSSCSKNLTSIVVLLQSSIPCLIVIRACLACGHLVRHGIGSRSHGGPTVSRFIHSSPSLCFHGITLLLVCYFHAPPQCCFHHHYRWTDIDFLPDTGFGYPTSKIRLDSDLVRSDFNCNCNTVGP